MKRSIAGFVSRLNRTLGRAVFQTFGIVAGLFGLAALRGAWSGQDGGETAPTVARALVGVGCAALAWWCFRPGRRLSDLE